MESSTNRFTRFEAAAESLQQNLESYQKTLTSLEVRVSEAYSIARPMQHLKQDFDRLNREYTAYCCAINGETLSPEEQTSKEKIERFLKTSLIASTAPFAVSSAEIMIDCADVINNVILASGLSGREIFLPKSTVELAKRSLKGRVTISYDSRLGRGTQGTVFKADMLGRSVAAKRPDPGSREAVLRGAVMVLSLGPQTNAPKIEHIEKDAVYMEQGLVSLDKVLGDRKSHEQAIKSLVSTTRSLCSNLCELHEHGMAHLDVGLQNAMMFPSSHPLEIERASFIDFDRGKTSAMLDEQQTDIRGLEEIIQDMLTEAVGYTPISREERVTILGRGAFEEELMLMGRGGLMRT
ncbi:MAG: hypothetical protein HY860_00920 [Chlamydiales bacterium]|nr:hypothetical protein [Chlamydiales bacterium]